jgi:hypothetical protein
MGSADKGRMPVAATKARAGAELLGAWTGGTWSGSNAGRTSVELLGRVGGAPPEPAGTRGREEEPGRKRRLQDREATTAG